MSHPNPSHDRSNEYPDDHYKPSGKKPTIMGKMNQISAKTKALRKKMGELGGRFTKR